jgi:signal peptidase II
MEAAGERTAPIKPLLVLIATAAVVFLADQLTKALVVANVAASEQIELLGGVVQIWNVRNRGAAFSLFQGEIALFLVVTVLALAMIVYFHRSLRDRSLWLQALLGVILGGTLGNLVDRLRQGYVTDFVSVGIGDLRWPTFNVADSSIVVGIGLLVLYLAWADRRPEAEVRA